MLNPSKKSYLDDAIAKGRTPIDTVKWVLNQLTALEEPIFDYFYHVESRFNIPQFRIVGNDRFRESVYYIQDGSNGKGHTVEQALASGFMEFAERFSCYQHIANPQNYHINKYAVLPENAFKIENLYSNIPKDYSGIEQWRPYLANLPFRWYPALTVDGQTAYLPLEFIFIQSGGTANGMAAGNSFEEALVHAICEIIERDCFFRVLEFNTPTPLISQDSIHSSLIHDLLAKFYAQGFQVDIRDFSIDYNLPVLAVLSTKDEAFNLTIGVATEKKEALARALTENSQTFGSEETQQLITKQTLQRLIDNTPTEVIPFEDIPDIDAPDFKEEVENLDKMLKQLDKPLFYVDCTHKALQIPAAIAYIPNTFSPRSTQSTLLTAFEATARQTLSMTGEKALAHLLAEHERLGQTPDAWYYLRKAILTARRGDYAEANQQLTKHLDLAHQNKQAASSYQYRIGLYTFMTESPAKTYQLITSWLSSNPEINLMISDDIKSIISKMKSAHHQYQLLLNLTLRNIRKPSPEKPDQVLGTYNCLIKHQPEIKQLMEAYDKSEKNQAYKNSLVIIEKLRNIHPALEQLLNLTEREAGLLMITGQNKAAITAFEKIHQQVPNNLRILKYLILLHRKVGHIDESLQHLSKLKAHIPHKAWAEIMAHL
jgi:YcaO-like protein with predicted kinase domain